MNYCTNTACELRPKCARAFMGNMNTPQRFEPSADLWVCEGFINPVSMAWKIPAAYRAPFKIEVETVHEL